MFLSCVIEVFVSSIDSLISSSCFAAFSKSSFNDCITCFCALSSLLPLITWLVSSDFFISSCSSIVINFWFSAFIVDCSVRLSYMLFCLLSICPDIPSISSLSTFASAFIADNFSLYSDNSLLSSSYCSFKSLAVSCLVFLSFSMSIILSE